MEKKSTFALLKPDAFHNNHAATILQKLHDHGFHPKRVHIRKSPCKELAKQHLNDLFGKNPEAARRNVEFLHQGPVMALELTRVDDKDPIASLRELVGPTNPSEAKPHHIRSLSADDLELAGKENRAIQNRIHAADSPESAQREIEIWFES